MAYKKYLIFGLLVLLAIGLTAPSALADEQRNADVSIWDSSIPQDSVAGIFPIGGSGQIPGKFTVDTEDDDDVAIQVGLRAQERFVGPIEPIKNVYYVPTGESSPGLAKWNFDWSIDSGTTFLENQIDENLTPLNQEDLKVILKIKDNKGNSFKINLDDFPNPDGPIYLSQNSWNVGFGFIGLPIDSSQYQITLKVSDGDDLVAKSKIKVVVTDEVPKKDKNKDKDDDDENDDEDD